MPNGFITDVVHAINPNYAVHTIEMPSYDCRKFDKIASPSNTLSNSAFQENDASQVKKFYLRGQPCPFIKVHLVVVDPSRSAPNVLRVMRCVRVCASIANCTCCLLDATRMLKVR